MSVVVAKEDAARFIELADAENLEARVVADITAAPRLTMDWNGKTIVNLSRAFLNSNGAPKSADVKIAAPQTSDSVYPPLTKTALTELAASLALCSQKGLGERFDATIGRGTVLMPYGGKYQLTPPQTMAGKIPVLEGRTDAASLMAWGFDPHISEASPYHGAAAAVIHSVAKIIASGGTRKKCWLSFQEYFERLRDEPTRWGKPAAALLGALEAQLGLEVGAIGGKDSMSGSFEEIDVPPTLVSFAVSMADAKSVVSPEFKKAGSHVYKLYAGAGVYGKTDYKSLCGLCDQMEAWIREGRIHAAWAIGAGGAAEAVIKMSFGNHIGFKAVAPLTAEPLIGGFIVEADALPGHEKDLIGVTTEAYTLLQNGETIDFGDIQSAWEATLQPVYPYLIAQEGAAETLTNNTYPTISSPVKSAKPLFVIPVFPGTNCEYDTARGIERAGGAARILVIRNRSVQDIGESARALADAIRGAQGLVIPGGFSGGDEPDGSGKFITAFFRNAAVSDAVADLLQKRDGLMCGICNGFQALIKLGLVPYGEIRDTDVQSPTLTYNKIGRHQSLLAHTRVASNKSPWLSAMAPGAVYTVAVSHGEGRFIADESLIRALAENGQIATQYVDFGGNATQDIRFNPNNSDCAVEGVTSPDGRVFGRMCHNERYEAGLFKNVPGDKDMDIFAGAVAYYR
jgi:phosphoribosylformylglycinamidine synthase